MVRVRVAGPTDGGTVVTLHGAGFVVSPIYGSWCQWEGLASVPVRVLSARMATCQAPAASSSRSVHVNLRLNNVLSSSGIQFHFVSAPNINVYPLLGPVQGGTQVLLDGRALVSTTWWCRFGQTTFVLARQLTSERLQVCIGYDFVQGNRTDFSVLYGRSA